MFPMVLMVRSDCSSIWRWYTEEGPSVSPNSHQAGPIVRPKLGVVVWNNLFWNSMQSHYLLYKSSCQYFYRLTYLESNKVSWHCHAVYDYVHCIVTPTSSGKFNHRVHSKLLLFPLRNASELKQNCSYLMIEFYLLIDKIFNAYWVISFILSHQKCCLKSLYISVLFGRIEYDDIWVYANILSLSSLLSIQNLSNGMKGAIYMKWDIWSLSRFHLVPESFQSPIIGLDFFNLISQCKLQLYELHHHS